MTEFDVVLADPPWPYSGSPTKSAAAAKHYPLMSERQIVECRIDRLLAPRGVAFVWATSPKLDVAIRCIEAWGLQFRGVAFVWVKTRADGTVIGAQGVRPSITKPTTEFVLAASRVGSGRPMRLASESVAQVVLAPRGAHSAKPAVVMERIEALYPCARRIELFARQRRDGWDDW